MDGGVPRFPSSSKFYHMAREELWMDKRYSRRESQAMFLSQVWAIAIYSLFIPNEVLSDPSK